MPLGVRALGSFRLGEPLAKTVLTHVQYLDGIASLVAAGFTRAQAEQIMGSPRKPYTNGADVATATLYPSLAGYADARAVVRGASCGHYQIALNGYGVLPYWKSAAWTQALNEPDTLTFDYPANADYATNLLRPNEITIFDGYGQTVQILQLTDIIPNVARSGDGVTVKVSARGLLGQLSDEWVTSYTGTATIPAHVAALMAQFQTAASSFSVGEVYDPLAGATVTVSFADKSLLDCIRELHKLTGSKGQYTVTPSRRFVWVARLGSAKAVDIALGFNLKSLERRPDMTEFASCLYVYGAGLSPAERLAAYRTSASAVAAYGTVIRRITLENVTVQADLDAYADELIDVVSVPTIEYSVSAADLASINAGAAFTIGGSAHIQDIDLAVDTTQDVVSIKRSLDSPLDITFGFAKREKTLATLLQSLSDRIAAIETRDDTARIETSLHDGFIAGVPRTDFDAPRTNDFSVTGTTPASVLSYSAPDAGGVQSWVEVANAADVPTVPAFSDTEPPAVGTGTAGTSNDIARGNHTHDGPTLGSATPAAVATVAVVGTSANAPHEDHAHAPWVYSGRKFEFTNFSDIAALPYITFGTGDVVALTGTNKYTYVAINGAWRIVGPFNQTTAPSSQGEADGDLWYEPTADVHYARRNGAWRFTTTWTVANYAALATAPTSVTIADGDRAYVADVDIDLVRRSGAWRLTGPLPAANYAALASAPANVTIADGDRAYIEDVDIDLVRRNSVWRLAVTLSVANFAALASDPANVTITDGDHAYCADLDNEYVRRAGAWRAANAFVSTSAPSSIGEASGDTWHDSTNKYTFTMRDGAWWIMHPFYAASAPSTNVHNGDVWYDSTNHKAYRRINGAWVVDSHWTT